MRNFYFLKLVVAGLFSVFALTAEAQKPYLKLGGSYQFGLDSNPVTVRSGNVFPNQTFNLKHEGVGINYGEGATFTGALGYMFSANIGAEVGLSYLKGKNLEAESRFFYPDYMLTEVYRFETNSRMTLISPALVLTTASGKFRPYAKLGFLLALGKVSETEYSSIYTESLEINAQYTGGKGFGFQSAAGVTLEASPGFALFLELNANNLRYAPKKWEITEVKENKMKVAYNREITYDDSFTQYYNEEGMPVNETRAHQIYLPMSSVGIGLGMKINL